jgi:hypothetical protein
MKKLLTFVMTMLLGASLSFAQATGGSTDKQAGTGRKKVSKTKKHHKGGKKGTESTTPPAK